MPPFDGLHRTSPYPLAARFDPLDYTALEKESGVEELSASIAYPPSADLGAFQDPTFARTAPTLGLLLFTVLTGVTATLAAGVPQLLHISKPPVLILLIILSYIAFTNNLAGHVLRHPVPEKLLLFVTFI